MIRRLLPIFMLHVETNLGLRPGDIERFDSQDRAAGRVLLEMIEAILAMRP